MVNENNEVQTNVKGILGVFRSFYRKLYARSNNYALKQDEILSVTEGRARPKVETSSLFKKDLLQGTMGEFTNNRTPGPDGLPAEFYKVFYY